MNYTDLKKYCDAKKLTYREFASIVAPRRQISMQHLYQIITGRSKGGKRAQRHLDRWINDNRSEICTAITTDTISTGTVVPPSPEIPPEPDDAGGSRPHDGEGAVVISPQ